jgi:histone H2A
LRIAAEKRLRSIAFPAVGTGIAGFAVSECAQIMLREVVVHLKTPTSIEKIYFVLFDSQALGVFEKVWSEMGARGELDGASAAGR